jgi:ribulose-bisphosphate carboxylase large chain
VTGSGPERLRVTYRMAAVPGSSPATRAREIAIEQTAEVPASCIPGRLEGPVVGTVESAGADDATWRAVVSYDVRVAGDELPQLLTLLYGNVSLQTGTRIEAVDWPDALLDAFGGPRLGVDGLRAACGIAGRRPLLCAALKPLGLDPDELARRATAFAAGGADLVKDDHGLADQTFAPFARRVPECAAAIAAVNARRGTTCLYVPNVTAPAAALGRRLRIARNAGCGLVMLSPLVVGLDTMHAVARDEGFGVIAHPALAGAFFAPGHGIAPEVLLGELFRIAGADAVIYPNAGGRFPFDEPTCVAVHRTLRRPLGALRPSLPALGGGIDATRVGHWIDVYGPDTMFLVGGSLFRAPDLESATAELGSIVRGRTATNEP